MVGQVYALMWLSFASVMTALYLGGSLDGQLLAAVGFVAATLVFIGMSVVLPLSVSQQGIDQGRKSIWI